MKVLVALSGGVDSAVAAALVAEAGHHTVGVTMKLWGGESDSGCCSVADVEDARRSAAQLGIEHHVFNFADEFESAVVEPYVDDHVAGRTPNPCIECNRHLKFDLLLRRAELLGFDAVATGHHARIVTGPGAVPHVARGADRAKDQSYVLYPLRSSELGRVLFPIGHLTKAEVRALAAERGLRPATKPDSQDVCFITSNDGRRRFLSERTELHSGTVVDVDGRVLGETEAVELVTVGQRRGLELAGAAQRRFVVDVDTSARRVTVGPPEALMRTSVQIREVVWADGPITGAVLAQCSAHGEAVPARVRAASGNGSVAGEAPTVTVVWDRARRRVAPGQSVVLYRDDVVVGGGIAV